MQLAGLRNNAAVAVVSGFGLATGWYLSSSALLSGSAGAIIPALGAIALAGIVPILILNCRKKEYVLHSCPEMEQRFEALNKHVSLNIVNENNELTDVSEKFLSLTGYSREELFGKPINILFCTSCQEVREDIHKHLTRGETWAGQTRLQRKDGRLLYTQATITPLLDEAGDWAGSISAHTDVAHTNKLIPERHTAQALYELRDDIWIIDAETEKFGYMNRAAKARLRVRGEDYRGRSLEELNVGNCIDGVLRACRALRSNGDSSTQFEATFMGVAVNVSIKFLLEAERTGGYLILFTDISDRIEQETRKSEFISTVSHELRSPMTSIKGAMGLLLARSAGELPDKALDLLEIAHRNADRMILIMNDILDLDKICNGQMEFEIKNVDLAELISETDQANMMLQQSFGVKVELIGTHVPVHLRTDPNRFIQVLTNLLSNAYKFSRPNSRILIEVQDISDHVRVSVRDEGLGILPDERYKKFLIGSLT